MKKLIDKLKKLDKGTAIRTILMVAAFINQMVALVGQTTFASSAAYQLITFVVTIITCIVCYWYNNDWSDFSMLCRDVFDMLEDGRITPSELKAFIKKYEKNDEMESVLKEKEEAKEHEVK